MLLVFQFDFMNCRILSGDLRQLYKVIGMGKQPLFRIVFRIVHLIRIHQSKRTIFPKLLTELVDRLFIDIRVSSEGHQIPDIIQFNIIG